MAVTGTPPPADGAQTVEWFADPPAPAPAAQSTTVPPAEAVDRGGSVRDVLAALLAGAFLAAIAFAGQSGQQLGRVTPVVVALLLAGGTACAVAVLRARGQAPLPAAASAAVVLALALAALSAVSIAWAVQPADAWIETNRTLAYAAAFAGAAALARLAPDRWRAVLGGALLACLVVAGYALLTKVLPAELNPNELLARLREPYGYWNAVGLTGALAVPACLWLGARRDGRPLLDALAFPALALAVATVLLAYSRGSLLAAAAGLALWFAFVPLRLRGAAVLLVGGGAGALVAAWSFTQDALSRDGIGLAERVAGGIELAVLIVAALGLVYAAGLAVLFAAEARPLRPRTRRRIGIALLVAVALAPVAAAGALATTPAGLGGSVDRAWTSLTDPAADAPSNDPGRLTGVASVRSRYWRDALAIWRDEPVLGAGAGGFATARARYRQDRLEVRHAHGQIVQTLADLGVVGLALTLLLVLAWALAARRSLRAARGAERAGLLTLTAVTAVLGVHVLIDWTWFVPGPAVLGIVCAGWVAGRGHRRTGRPPGAAPRATRLAALGVVVLALVASWIALQPGRAVEADAAALTALDQRRFDDARALVAEARDRDPLSVEPFFTLAAVERAAGRRAAAERALEAATELQPANPATWQRLAAYRFRVQRDPRPALEAARAGIFLDPRSFELTQLYIDIARALDRRGERG